MTNTNAHRRVPKPCIENTHAQLVSLVLFVQLSDVTAADKGYSPPMQNRV